MTTTFNPNTFVRYLHSDGRVYDIDFNSRYEGTSLTEPTYAAITARSYHLGVVNALASMIAHVTGNGLAAIPKQNLLRTLNRQNSLQPEVFAVRAKSHMRLRVMQRPTNARFGTLRSCVKKSCNGCVTIICTWFRRENEYRTKNFSLDDRLGDVGLLPTK